MVQNDLCGRRESIWQFLYQLRLVRRLTQYCPINRGQHLLVPTVYGLHPSLYVSISQFAASPVCSAQMNFAIEVPAESNPLTPETLFQVLRSASSNDQQQVQTGTKQLQNWEKCPGFHSSLQSLYIVTSLPLELRYLSIIQLKNGIDKYWRKAAANAIKKDEKEIIKSRSVESTLTEGDVRLALQASIIIGKVVRSEYPHDW